MKTPTPILILFTLLTTLLPTIHAAAPLNTSREFYLKTHLKPNQPAPKAAYANLYVNSYHTGAGSSDAVLTPEKGVKAFLNGSVGGVPGGPTYQNALFDFNSTFPWYFDMEINDEFYSAWQPVQIDAWQADQGPSGFWINSYGLQWTNAVTEGPNYTHNAFAGWFVCDWWHGAPQLFFRIDGYNEVPAPCSCADVYLCPEFI